MSRKMLFRSCSTSSSSTSSASAPLHKRRPLLHHSHSSASSSTTASSCFAEVAGETTAECAAICCCCPCGLVNLLVLTIYKVPAGLCRRALRRKRRQYLIKNELLPLRTRRCKCGCDDTELQIHPIAGNFLIDDLPELKSNEEEAMVKLEKEMWETFYGTGFWRSPSQREPRTPKRSTSSP